MTIDLSILCAASASRRFDLLPASLKMLYGLKDRLSPVDKARVEIIYLVDDHERSVGEKRQALLEMSQGRYVAFVDDDDRVEPWYLSELLRLTASRADVLCFPVMVHQPYLAQTRPELVERPCFYDYRFPSQTTTATDYRRWPNHLMATKRELALQVGFLRGNRGEDVDFAARLHPLITSQADSTQVLYHYDFDDRKTLTQIEDAQPIAALVLISWAHHPELRAMTQAAIDSAHASGPYAIPGALPVVVIEQDRNAAEARYNNAHTVYRPLHVYPGHQFNYNIAAEEGIREAIAYYVRQFGRDPELVVVANNDVVFQRGWLAGLLDTHRRLSIQRLGEPRGHVISAVDDWDTRQKDILQDEEGMVTGRHLAGWCFAIEPALWRALHDPNAAITTRADQHLDSTYPYWCADNAMTEQLLALTPTPRLVVAPAFRVAHLESKTGPLQVINPELTWGSIKKWNETHGTHILANDVRYQRYDRGLPPDQGYRPTAHPAPMDPKIRQATPVNAGRIPVPSEPPSRPLGFGSSPHFREQET